MVYLRWNQLQQHATSVLLWSTEQTRSGFDLVCLRTRCSGLDHPPVSTRTMLQPCPRMSCCWKAPMSLGAAVLGEQALLPSARSSVWFLHEIGTLSIVTVNALLAWSVCSLQEGCWELCLVWQCMLSRDQAAKCQLSILKLPKFRLYL